MAREVFVFLSDEHGRIWLKRSHAGLRSRKHWNGEFYGDLFPMVEIPWLPWGEDRTGTPDNKNLKKKSTRKRRRTRQDKRLLSTDVS